MKDKLNDCFKSGEKGERHKGLRKIEFNEDLIRGHLKKAIHNFNAMDEFNKRGYSDWSASASFYCLYHCLLSILAIHNFNAMDEFNKRGYSDWSASASFYCLYHCLLSILAKNRVESRNQICTFVFIEKMIENKQLSITEEELNEIFDKDVKENLVHSDKILDIREKMQYSVKTLLENKEFNFLKNRTKILFDKLRMEIEK